MCLSVASLNSGSNGNCYYVASDNEAVLVDVGISCKEIEKRMLRIGLSIQKIKAIFITHEHADHIYGLASFIKKYPVPVYITSQTLTRVIDVTKDLIRSFNNHEAIIIGDIFITAFPKLHDAVDPCAFIISCKDVSVGVFTDIGSPCNNVINYFKQCNAAFLETNYDAGMLYNGRYPYILKKRISGGKGHLSNMEALELFIKHKPSFMTHLFLSHLSNNNNTPEIAKALFNTHAGSVNIIVASRFIETAVYTINAQQQVNKVYSRPAKPTQLKLAFV